MTGAAKESMPAGTTAGTPQILLAHHLKHLKLPTVLRGSSIDALSTPSAVARR